MNTMVYLSYRNSFIAHAILKLLISHRYGELKIFSVDEMMEVMKHTMMIASLHL